MTFLRHSEITSRFFEQRYTRMKDGVLRASLFLYTEGCQCEVLECEENMRLDNDKKEEKEKG